MDNRVIKFRAKGRVDDEWHYGFLSANTTIQPPIYFITTGLSHDPTQMVKTETISQFTGLYDKNGKEIYEGDLHLSEAIVDGEPHKSYLPIVFDNGAFWVDESFKKDGTVLTLLAEYDEPINIQGNIYQNPELLNN